MRMRSTFLATLLIGVLGAASASAEFRVERTLPLASGGTFILETDVGGVTMVGDSPSGATVTLTSRRDDFEERFDVRFEETAGTARVIVKRKGGWLSGLWGPFSDSTHFAIHVPQKTVVNLSTAGGSIGVSKVIGNTRVRTSGGSLRIEDVDGQVDGSTSGGSIRLRDVGGDAVVNTSGGAIDVTGVRGTLKAHTSGGSIEIDGVSGDLSASTSGGGVDVRGAGGYVEAHTSGGTVTVSFAPKNNRGGDLSTSGGGVRAEIDPGVALSIDARSSGGDVSSSVPVTVSGSITKGALRGDLNGGGATLRLRSSGGGVRISSASSVAERR